MTGYTLVEPCCGSAALTLHLLGATKPLMPYQGTKWRHRFALEDLLRELGFEGPPAKVELSDVSAWPIALDSVLHPSLRAELIQQLRNMTCQDPKSLFDKLQGVPAPDPQRNRRRLATEFLFLQRLAFSGKAVGMKGGVWKSPGFNGSSAYGLEATERFGKVKPMLPSLIRVLESYELKDVEVEAWVHHADPSDSASINGPTVVYIDPAYQGTTGYPDGAISRTEVLNLAWSWWEAGAGVIVSEAEPLELPGWKSKRLYEGRDDTSPFRGKQEEWVTFARARNE